MISMPVGLLVKMLNQHKAEAEGEPDWGPDPYPKDRAKASKYEGNDEATEPALFNHGRLGAMYPKKKDKKS